MYILGNISRYFLLDAFSLWLACASQIILCLCQVSQPLLGKIYITSTAWLWRELDLCSQNAPVFPEQPSFQYRFIITTSAEIYAPQKFYHNHILETKISLADWTFSPSFGKDSDDKIATEQLTALVDVTFMPYNNPEIS